MNKRTRSSVSMGFVLLCGLLVGFPTPAHATKSSSKKCDAKSESRMTAAGAPKESHTAFSRVSARRIHGVSSLRQPSAQRSVRRSFARLNDSRVVLAQRERILDSSRIRIIDGDTFAYGLERIRIQGFNAVERSDPDGFDATQRLDKLLHEGRVTMIPKATDIYGRTVAEVFVDRRNVADLLKSADGTTH